MKNIINTKNLILVFTALIMSYMISCKKEEAGNDFPVVVKLLMPAVDSVVALDTDTDPLFVFEWSEQPGAAGNVKYNILFDKEGTLFSSPVYTIVSDENGTATKLSLPHSVLDSIAAKAGIAPKRSGNISWAIDAVVGNKTYTSAAGIFKVNRPTSLGTVPTDLYIYGTATDAGNNPANAIHFHKNATGVFELFTNLKSGSYKIVNAPSADAKGYYLVDGEMFQGDQEMEYSLAEKTNLLNINFNNAEGSVILVMSIEVIVAANGEIIATLVSQGNNIFKADNVVFSFLVPGGPGSPAWLSWVEERYRFMIRTGEGDIFYGSYSDASMWGVYIEGMPIFPYRPDGDQPAEYFNVYAIPPTIDNYVDWAGCYKFASAADGNPVNIMLNLDPEQSVYVHSVVPVL